MRKKLGLGPKQKKYVERLRTTRIRQIVGGNLERGCGACALGIGSLMYEKPQGHVNYTLLRKELRFNSYGIEKVWRMNDNQQLSFREIADRIEESPGRFFREKA